MGGRRALFLDRDGTLNVEVGYLDNPDSFQLIPGAGEAIRAMNQAGWLVILISNQSGVGRGYFDKTTLKAIHARMELELARMGARLDDIFYCPHTPDKNCTCRKPSPELILRAAQEHGIDLERSWMAGDKATDVEAAHRAGCHAALVLSGYGREELPQCQPPDLVTEDLGTLVRNILDHEKEEPL